MMSALWKIKRKPRIENNDKSGDSIYRTLHLVSMFEFFLANLVCVTTFQLDCFSAQMTVIVLVPFPHHCILLPSDLPC